MSHDLVLYSNSAFSSPYVLSVYAALHEKGLPFEVKTVDLDTGENLTEDFARLSMTSRIPALVAGEFSLSESSAIIEYLEEAYPYPEFKTVFPSDLQQRARARQIQAWVRSDMGALREERPTTVIYSHKNPQPLSTAGQQAAAKLLHVADTLIDEDANFLFGAWSIADVDLYVMLNRLCANGDPVAPKIQRYVDRQSAQPYIQDWWSLARGIRSI
ncbi:glutathione transferase [Candidimonas sp. SYP-B2681]|uniref:glutathione transferase n=1 Tax=Candidimonas sp. SYP-B2681 TaxID=2497686 RepID=UPI000F89C46A|nr:glutathione transferase [Candidimonas sp. SYP-B2681]RTZ43366.1 glutathione transferase [Candidimonas sp. SYP-B2681]